MLDLRQTLRRPLHVILDWDGTITKKDTLGHVGSIPYRKQSPPDLPPWSYFVDAYLKDYTTHQANYTPAQSSRTTLREERAWLASLAPIEARSVHRVESSQIFRGVTLDDVHATAVQAVESKAIQLRPGWLNLIGQVHGSPLARKFLRQIPGAPTFADPASEAQAEARAHSHLSILSVNWSQQFIRSALGTALAHAAETTAPISPSAELRSLSAAEVPIDAWVSDPPTLASSARVAEHLTGTEESNPISSYIGGIAIMANELSSLHTPSGCDGRLSKSDDDAGIRTAGDKLARLSKRFRKRLDAMTTTSSPSTVSTEDEIGPENQHAVVYVGDSVTDLECLVAVDVGICMRDDPMGSTQREMAETLERIGVKCVRLREAIHGAATGEETTRTRRASDSSQPLVYWVEDLQEIVDVMETCQREA